MYGIIVFGIEVLVRTPMDIYSTLVEKAQTIETAINTELKEVLK